MRAPLMRLSVLLVATLAVGLAGLVVASCDNGGVGTTNNNNEVTKAQARALPTEQWPEDWCATQGWYGDGECDDFCPQPDSDCGQVCGPIENGACPAGQVCDIQSCGVGATGVCVGQPDVCADEALQPVCGCDDNTYDNDCARLLAGVAKAHDGPCDRPADYCGGIEGIVCAEGFVCDVEGCGDDLSGVCVPHPGACAEVYMPVCGCDGVTYGNDCERLLAGVAKDHDGDCDSGGDVCGPIPNGECADGQTCDIQSCGMGATGVCVPRPDACADIYAPVCGCDGVTYGNDCERVAAGVARDHEGVCQGGGVECGPMINTVCDDGEVCDLPSCGQDAVGVCVTRPEACAEIYAPVCGCDGVTYGNDCERIQAGVAKDHEGVCEQPADFCGGMQGIVCGEGQVCDIQVCAADASGVCVTRPEACAEIYAPVCGCDGVTYGNDCERLQAGVAKAADGACDAMNQ